jgi:hypothetical protein
VLFGTTFALTPAQLAALYPTHAEFTRQWVTATANAVKAGYILPVDGLKLSRVGAESTVPVT